MQPMMSENHEKLSLKDGARKVISKSPSQASRK